MSYHDPAHPHSNSNSHSHSHSLGPGVANPHPVPHHPQPGIRRPAAPTSLSFVSNHHNHYNPHHHHQQHAFPSPYPSPAAHPHHPHHAQPVQSPHTYPNPQHSPTNLTFRHARTPSFTKPEVFSPAGVAARNGPQGPRSAIPSAAADEPESYFAFNPPPEDAPSPTSAPPTPSGMPGHPHHSHPHMNRGPGRPDLGGYSGHPGQMLGQPMPSPHAYGQPLTPGHRIDHGQGQGQGQYAQALAGPGPSALRHAQGQGQGQAQGQGAGQSTGPSVNGVPIPVPAKKVGGASDFVKKLYKMLEDDQYSTVVSWGNNGDSFVVKDMNEFTKTILPRHFKHSNFASFVRQLNKYDFHKVKNPEEGSNAYGDHTWEFRHPQFRADTKNSLDAIKRKAPAVKKTLPPSTHESRQFTSEVAAGPGGGVMVANNSQSSENYSALQQQVDALNRMQQDMNVHMTTLSKDYQSVISDMLNFQKSMVAQDQLMQNLIQYLVTLEQDKKDSNANASGEGPFLPSDQAQKLISSYTDVARASFEQMNEISRRASVGAAGHLTFPGFGQMVQQQEQQQIAGPSRHTGSPDLFGAGQPQPQPRTGMGTGPGTGGGTAPGSAQSGGGGTSPDSTPSASGSAYDPTMMGVNTSPQQTRSTRTPVQQGASPQNGYSGTHQPPQQHPPHLNGDILNASSPATAHSIPSPVSLADYANAAAGGPTGLSMAPMGMQTMGSGLRVFTVGHLRPRDESGGMTPGTSSANGHRSTSPNGRGQEQFGLQVPSLEELPPDMPRLDATGPNAEAHGYGRTSASPLRGPGGGGPGASPTRADGSPDGDSGTPGASGLGQTLRIRRSTYVPGWAVPPRVLLVEDDAVCRKLSSKFLQVFGCAIDVAVDGVSAVNKMNLEKYDLVLMDIVMPNLDGVSATSLIRQFDPMTPIISMTSNSNPTEIMTYFSHGMNDILPKPFTKEGLLGMLEKHLMHLKAMQQMAEIPRALGVPDDQINDALLSSLGAGIPGLGSLGGGGAGSDQPGTPGMSMNDYVAMIQNLVNNADGEGSENKVAGQKRIGGPDRDDEEQDGRTAKRGRFVEEEEEES